LVEFPNPKKSYLYQMKITFFSTQSYDKASFEKINKDFGFALEFQEVQLNEQTAFLARGSEAVCVFVNDQLNRETIRQLSELGIRVIALRCAGFNNVDLAAAKSNGVKVVRVPAYSPHAVAEHAVAMILTLNRKTHKAYNRVREQNFSLQGLLGFDLYQKTVGVIGTGNIGQAFCNIMLGFGCRVLAFDIFENKAMVSAGVRYVPLVDLLPQCDIISLHSPLNEQTKQLINKDTISKARKGFMLINTSRGGLIETSAVIEGLKSRQIGALGIDVYEQEEKLFFRDLSEKIIEDDTIARLMTFPNVLITAHQGFFTEEALTEIGLTTLKSLKAFKEKTELVNEVRS
jgi:D-lactate dehydrogenase